MSRKILILGASGTGRAVFESLADTGEYSEIAFLDNFQTCGNVYGIPIIGKSDDYALFRNDFSHAFVAMANNDVRMDFIQKLLAAGYILPVVISPSAHVSKYASVGPGTFVNTNGVVQPSASLGTGCIIGTSAVAEHDTVFDDGVCMGPGALTTGGVVVGKKTFIGAGACILNKLKIGAGVMVAAGAIVTSDVPDGVMVAGVPAVVKKHLPDGVGAVLPF